MEGVYFENIARVMEELGRMRVPEADIKGAFMSTPRTFRYHMPNDLLEQEGLLRSLAAAEKKWGSETYWPAEVAAKAKELIRPA